ncbi:ABC transporter permease [Streptococcus minor]|uniref:ABC transporter permease n=1 Tax=Streptococcus minor TaxID=229549 RepID=A0A3P1VE21_9STRE|nr:ABC transporter permease [Streptococcus minor]MDO5078588.1 ABC transporter permease [Streptococcus minor]RRD31927.1 ABC transporter permease [Streptococcus minor]
MLDYFQQSSDELIDATIEHLFLVLKSLGIALILASILIVLILKNPRLKTISVYSLSILYAIPSFAFFALLIPWTGLGQVTATIVLVLYAQYILVRTFLTGIYKVEPSILEAARGMGMNFWQVLFKIQLPLAKPAIFSGIRLATLSLVAIATIAATINAGGLGTILFDGLRTMSMVKLSWGILLSVGLSLLLSLIIGLVENLFDQPGLS